MKSFLAEQKLLYCICKSVKNANCKSHSIICNRIWKSSFFVLRLCMTMLKNFVQKTSAIGCFCIWNIYIEFHPQEPARELKDQFSIILVVHQFRKSCDSSEVYQLTHISHNSSTIKAPKSCCWCCFGCLNSDHGACPRHHIEQLQGCKK